MRKKEYNVWGFKLRRLNGLSLACRDRNIWEVSKTMYNFVHYTEFHLPSPGSKSGDLGYCTT